MNSNIETSKRPSSLTKVFDKFEHILCQQLNSNQIKSKGPNFINSESSEIYPKEQEIRKNNMTGLITDYSSDEEPNERRMMCEVFINLLQETLRNAKPLYLECSEVLLPQSLTWRLAEEVISASSMEPCGLRGCIVYIHVQEKKSNSKRIGIMRFDRTTVATFEIHLTLFQDTCSWLSLRQLLPSKLLKTMGKKTALVISEHFTMTKKKLYRSASM